MGNESSQMSGLELEEKAIEITDHWTLFTASVNSCIGNTDVSIFKGELAVRGRLWDNASPLEKSAKNLMLHRHPCILKYITSWSKGSNFYLAVESVRPLGLNFNQQSSMQICLGLRNIIQALAFLHDQAYSYHNNICISNIYITENGIWKLGGLEYLARKSDVTKEFLVKSRPFRCSKLIDPDEIINNAKGSDQYALSILVLELLKKLNDDDLLGITEFKEYCTNKLRHSNLDMRPSFSALLLHPFFNHDFILIYSFLSDLAIKSANDKNDFFKKLHTRLKSLNENDTAFHLNELLLSRMVLSDLTAQAFLLPHLFNPKTISNPDGLFSESVFQKNIIPTLLKVFRVRDLQIRMILLQYFLKYLHLFSKTDLSEHVLPELLLGLKDSNDELVAMTLRSLAELVPVLGSAIVVGGKRERFFADGRPKDLAKQKLIDTTIGECKISSKLNLLNHDENICVDTLNSKNSFEISERLSPDGGEDIITSASQQSDAKEWYDWDNDCTKFIETNNIVQTLSIPHTTHNKISKHEDKQKPNSKKINEKSDLKLKIQDCKFKEQADETDFFRDMEPVIKKTDIFFVDDEAIGNKSLLSASAWNKFDISCTGADDDWDKTLNEWSE